jgi:hypothetical protein
LLPGEPNMESRTRLSTLSLKTRWTKALFVRFEIFMEAELVRRKLVASWYFLRVCYIFVG